MKAYSAVRAVGFVFILGLVFVGVLLSWNMPKADGAIETGVIAPAEQLGKAFAMVAAHVKPSVVSVYSEKTVKIVEPDFDFSYDDNFLREYFGDEPGSSKQRSSRPREFHSQQYGMASGMILSKEGHVLTNYHLVRDTDELRVMLPDKRVFVAEVVGVDPQTDVAVIKLKGAVPPDLATITLGDSDAQHSGHLILTIGAPFGLAQTVTNGIISATGRSDIGISNYENFLQTDAPINPGNSGGPLVNMRGEVVGMNSAIASNAGQFAGVGFAIPSNLIKVMLPKLLKGEKIVRGQLGVVIQDLTRELARHFGLSETKGVLIAQINPDSAAMKAGLRIGDVITLFDGHGVESVRQLRNLVAATMPGTKVDIEVFRGGKGETVTAIVSQQDNAVAANSQQAEGVSMLAKFGLSIQSLTPELARQLGVGAGKGVAVNDVAEGGLAWLAGLKKGDVITEVERQPVSNAQELEQALGMSGGKEGLLMRIQRPKGSLFIVLQTR